MKKQIFTTGILFITLLLSGFSSCRGKEEKKNVSIQTVKLATSNTSALYNPSIQIADEEGIYEKTNVKVKYIPLDRDGSFEALATGKVDATYANVIPQLSMGAQGTDIVAFAGTQGNGMVVVARPEVADKLKDLRNWKGITIAVQHTTTVELIARYALAKKWGYKIGEDIFFKSFPDYPTAVLAAVKNNAEVALPNPQTLESALTQGLVYLFPSTVFEEDYVCCRQFANGNDFRKNPEKYKNYIKGQIYGYKILITDKQKAVDSLVKASGQTESYVEKYFYDKEYSGHRTYKPDPNYNGTLILYETMEEIGMIENPLPLSSFFDIKVYAKALKEVINENPSDDFFKEMWDFFLTHNDKHPDFKAIASL